jgi:hypothetical protein
MNTLSRGDLNVAPGSRPVLGLTWSSGVLQDEYGQKALRKDQATSRPDEETEFEKKDETFFGKNIDAINYCNNSYGHSNNWKNNQNTNKPDYNEYSQIHSKTRPRSESIYSNISYQDRSTRNNTEVNNSNKINNNTTNIYQDRHKGNNNNTTLKWISITLIV